MIYAMPKTAKMDIRTLMPITITTEEAEEH